MFVVIAISAKLIHRWCIAPLLQKGPICEELTAALITYMLNIQSSSYLRKMISNQFYIKNCLIYHSTLVAILFAKTELQLIN